MTNRREELIEKAAKAIHKVAMQEYPGMEEWRFGWVQQKDYDRKAYLREAEAALAVFEQAHTPTDDGLRDEVERVQKAAWAEIHGQVSRRKYSVAEVKQLVYSFDNVIGSLLARRPVQGTPTNDEREASNAVVVHALEAYWGPQSTGFWFADQINAMRCALRAAFVAEQGGEQR